MVYCCHNNFTQILSQDFRFIFQFGKVILEKPRDVKLSKEDISVIGVFNPCFHLFLRSYVTQFQFKAARDLSRAFNSMISVVNNT